MATIFSKIIAEKFHHTRWQKTISFCFSGYQPPGKGPYAGGAKKEVDYLFDLEDELLTDMTFSKSGRSH